MLTDYRLSFTKMDLATIERPASLAHAVSKKLEQAILSGRFRPGERLVETTLAEVLGVSRGPIRDALRVLAVDGLVEIRPRGGAHVSAISREAAGRVIAIRAQLEGLAARYVAADQPAGCLKDMQRIVAHMSGAADREDRAGFRALDTSFHETMCRGANDHVLFQTWKSLRNSVLLYQGANLAVPRNLHDVAGSHRTLLDALKSRDPDAAEALFRSRIVSRGYYLIGATVPRALQAWINRADPYAGATPVNPDTA